MNQTSKQQKHSGILRENSQWRVKAKGETGAEPAPEKLMPQIIEAGGGNSRKREAETGPKRRGAAMS